MRSSASTYTMFRGSCGHQQRHGAPSASRWHVRNRDPRRHMIKIERRHPLALLRWYSCENGTPRAAASVVKRQHNTAAKAEVDSVSFPQKSAESGLFSPLKRVHVRASDDVAALLGVLGRFVRMETESRPRLCGSPQGGAAPMLTRRAPLRVVYSCALLAIGAVFVATPTAEASSVPGCADPDVACTVSSDIDLTESTGTSRGTPLRAPRKRGTRWRGPLPRALPPGCCACCLRRAD